MPRKEFSRKVRREALERAAGHCENKACKAVLKPGEAEIDHILPLEMGGESVIANAQVLCRACHRGKSALDIKAIRKSDRARDKASGAIKPKQSISNRSFPQSEKAAKREAKPVAGMPEIFRRTQNAGS